MMVKYTKHAKKNVVIRLIPPVAGGFITGIYFFAHNLYGEADGQWRGR